MDISPHHPTLRLVRSDDAAMRRAMPGREAESAASRRESAERIPSTRDRAVERIARENAAAASLAALDPRWVLAVQVSRELQGGRAAVLTPEGRRRLLLVGNRLGLRAFDSNLVIAIVQDGARAGEDPLGSNAQGRMRLVGREQELADARPGPGWGMVAAVALIAGIIGAAIAVWLLHSPG
jgi:hypothetical protein